MYKSTLMHVHCVVLTTSMAFGILQVQGTVMKAALPFDTPLSGVTSAPVSVPPTVSPCTAHGMSLEFPLSIYQDHLILHYTRTIHPYQTQKMSSLNR